MQGVRTTFDLVQAAWAKVWKGVLRNGPFFHFRLWCFGILLVPYGFNQRGIFCGSNFLLFFHVRRPMAARRAIHMSVAMRNGQEVERNERRGAKSMCEPRTRIGANQKKVSPPSPQQSTGG